MGYSATAAAFRVMEALEKMTKAEGAEISNAMPKESYECGGFYEIDTNKEFEDGKIVGEVFRMDCDGGCYPAGFFEIAGNGKVVKFSGLSKAYIAELEKKANAPFLIE